MNSREIVVISQVSHWLSLQDFPEIISVSLVTGRLSEVASQAAAHPPGGFHGALEWQLVSGSPVFLRGRRPSPAIAGDKSPLLDRRPSTLYDDVVRWLDEPTRVIMPSEIR